jgi:hypothetical protein
MFAKEYDGLIGSLVGEFVFFSLRAVPGDNEMAKFIEYRPCLFT